jgi:hypothetical protein
MNKTARINLRVTPAEFRAVNRFAKQTGHDTVAALFRARVIVPAKQYDPRQATLPLGKTG